MLSFGSLDWAIVVSYLVILTATAIQSSARGTESARSYFLAGNSMPALLIAVSVLSSTQSAATFLGGPDTGFRSDYTYLTSFAGSLVAAVIVAKVLLPRFYALRATTVYELLEQRFGSTAKRAAGAMYLLGRVFAAGARLYMAAIAVAMIIFLRVDATTITIASFILLVLGIVFTFVGGLKSVVWSDVVQVVIYVGAALLTLWFLLTKIPLDLPQIWQALDSPPTGESKLRLINTSLGLDQPFSLLAIFTGVMLLNLGNFGMDQDTSQRLLACKDSNEAARSLILSVLIAVPVIWIFITIGQLLHIFYQRPDLMGATAETMKEFDGEKISVFMSFILSEMPAGLKGIIVVGVVAAAAINSGLNSMASVIVEDFYRPWQTKQGRTELGEAHFVAMGQGTMVVCGCALFLMSILCYFWQRATDMPLLEFALSVMTFAYAGLLGVYFTAVFTDRGNTTTVLLALGIGFLTILALQPYVAKSLGLSDFIPALAFPFQLCIGATISTLICCAGRRQSNVSTLEGGSTDAIH
ncbi:sodium:solute symporter family transporter [Aquidulcibacter paucihalophilus]|uniref:sodium:solute symporter family transporter n=1 Tax=Aquidulcibacter paucihalophilus TaxID=1978549 RepID=UPI0022B7B728|nr:hypothetical protein [Aquidulcibacter paucihalophilus]